MIVDRLLLTKNIRGVIAHILKTEMWMPGEERSDHVLQNMVSSKIGYVIMDADRENECAVAFRRVALAADRPYFRTARGGHL